MRNKNNQNNNRIRFKYPHKVNEIVKPNFKVAGKKYVEELASTVQGGSDFCYSVKTAQSLEAKRKARNKRLSKSLNRQVEKSIAAAASRGYG